MQGCAGDSGRTVWSVNDQEYLETAGFNVLVFNDYYPEGDQGGIEFIHHDKRTAANGFINVQLPDDQRFPQPVEAVRVADRDKKEISATVKVAEFDFGYTIRIWPDKGSVHMAVDLEKPIPASWKGIVTFDLQLFPVTYQGKTFHLRGESGDIPVESLDNMISRFDGRFTPEPMASGPKLLIAPEDPLCRLEIEQVKGNM